MPATTIEIQAIVRASDAIDSHRKINPADMRIIFAGRLADKWQAGGTMTQTIAWVTADMRSLFAISPGTLKLLCGKQIARLLKAGDVAGRAHFVACLSEARRVGIIPRWLEKWAGLSKALAEADWLVQQAKTQKRGER